MSSASNKTSCAGRCESATPPFEWINGDAKLAIVGITPGLHQAQLAYAAARRALRDGLPWERATKLAKLSGSFGGPMRSNLCRMLDGVGVAECLGVATSSVLFDARRELLHTSSCVRYPVFFGGENYTGHTPKLLRHSALLAFVNDLLAPELAAVPDALIVPCGKAVSEALAHLVDGGKLDERRVLMGFPHPSTSTPTRNCWTSRPRLMRCRCCRSMTRVNLRPHRRQVRMAASFAVRVRLHFRLHFLVETAGRV